MYSTGRSRGVRSCKLIHPFTRTDVSFFIRLLFRLSFAAVCLPNCTDQLLGSFSFLSLSLPPHQPSRRPPNEGQRMRCAFVGHASTNTIDPMDLSVRIVRIISRFAFSIASDRRKKS
jgi:hypothetical protein